MKKKAILLAVCFAAVLAFGANSAIADDMVPGAYTQQDQSVMGVGQTMVQMGAKARALTDATNRASRAHLSRNTAQRDQCNATVWFLSERFILESCQDD